MAAIVALILSLAAAAPAGADDATLAELQALRRRVESLEARLAEQQRRSDPAVVDQMVADVLADARRRTGPTSATAGWDRGFFLAAGDGSFLLRPSAVLQFRGIASTHRTANTDERETQSGFEMRRARFQFDGHAISRDLTYRFIWDTSRQGGQVALLDAWVAWRFDPHWQVRLGQFVESWFRERDVAFANQLAVDRSLVETALGSNLTDRVQGISLIYGGVPDSSVRLELALHDGANSKNTDFRDEVVTGTTTTPNPANFGVGGRAEWKLTGDWDAYRDFTAKGTTHDLLVVGSGFDFTQRGDENTLLATADVQVETATGWNAWAAAVINHYEGGENDGRLDYGFVAQGGYLLNDHWEAFGRCSVVVLDAGFVSGEHIFPEYTVGVTHYLGPNGPGMHRAKLTFDIGYFPAGSPGNLLGIDVLPGLSSQWLGRVQFQLRI